MSRSRKHEVEELARQTLVDHGLYSVPVNPVVVAKKLGVRLAHAVFSDPKYSGLTARRGDELTILIKENDSPYRKRFTVAHEIGHCLLHLVDGPGEIVDTDADFFRLPPTDSEKWNSTRHQEWEANIFAAELLMPHNLVKEVWAEIPKEDRSLDVMAKVFQVSQEAMGYRLAELGIFTDEVL